MRSKRQFVCILLLSVCLLVPQVSRALEIHHVNARSAILLDMKTGKILFEQNADSQIAPASLTKILTLYLTFEAIRRGQISLHDKVRISRRAASMPSVRMGLKAGEIVPVYDLIKGIAVVSGNDAAVAMAEHVSGSVERFVQLMNAKARELGMTRSHFMTPNGLPAPGQVTTARDILKLSVAYIRRFPEALAIHSMTSYTWDGHTHHNCNNLLRRCPGVDGLKTGFVCASGYNISATALRDHTRMIAVVLGARNPWIRMSDAEKLLEAGYREVGGPYYAVGSAAGRRAAARRTVRHRRVSRVKRAGKHQRLAAHHRARSSALKKLALNSKARISRQAKKKKVRHRKTYSRHAVNKSRHARVVLSRRPSHAKSLTNASRLRGHNRARSAKKIKKRARTAEQKRDKVIHPALALQKETKG